MPDNPDPRTDNVSPRVSYWPSCPFTEIVQNNPKWAGLSGFAILEQYMMDLDESMVADYNDDINTLLTFVRGYIHLCSLRNSRSTL